MGESSFELIFFHNSQHDYDDKVLRDNVAHVLKFKNEIFKEKDRAFAVDFRNCLGRKCPFKGDCSYINGLQKAKESHVVVGNHALTFSWQRDFLAQLILWWMRPSFGIRND